MTLQPRHIVLATLLHVVLFTFLFVGVQCSQPIPPTPVVQGVLINPSQLPQPKPPVQNPSQTKPEESDQGPQQIVKSDVVADQAKEEQQKAAAAAAQQQQEKAQQEAAARAAEEQRKKDEQAKAEELKRVEDAQRQAAEKAAEQKKQQEEEAKRQAEAQAAAAKAAEEQRKKDLEEQLRKEAQEKQEAQAAALAQKKKAEEARQEADRRKRAQELQAALGAENGQLMAQVQSQWAAQLQAALAGAWARPPGTDQNLKAFIIITLAENGQVQSASVETSSGMTGFDDSVVSAAYKASPMPTPADPAAFRHKVEVCFSPNPRNCQQ